ncbi:MAG: putative Ig domain-containing protein [Ignavibacteriaceae bacterium]|nr:putative Ig domain-containing protein [Ignavibacteriaceae bacterium]
MVFTTSFPQPVPADSLYLGQTPPGNIPKIFNLPVTSGFRALERIAVSSGGDEIYYGEINTYPVTALRVRLLRYRNDKWEGPFNVFEGFMAPKLADNDSTIYLQDNHFYAWYSKRTESGWSVPALVLPGGMKSHYLQKTSPNNYYLSSYYEGAPAPGDICKLITTGNDTVLQSLGKPLNSSSEENDFLIASDESFVLFSRKTTEGASDMFISFRKNNGGWTNPKNLGAPVNKPHYNWEYGQFISSDGKYLFFTSGGLNWSSYYTYWIKIDNIIDSLRHSNFAPYLNNLIPNQSGLTGQSFTYTIPDSTFIDDDGNNSLTFSAVLSNGNPLPSWLSFDPGTRTFTGTPTAADNLTVKVSATDNYNLSASATFTINISVTGVDDNIGHLPGEIELFQNYPNPFNPTTSIEFIVSRAGRYSLNLYNSLGKLVKVIADNQYDAGHHKEEFDATGLTSGIYIYRLTGGAIGPARKLVVLQ